MKRKLPQTKQKQFIGLARNSSGQQDQKASAASLDAQEQALRAAAQRQGGKIIKVSRIAKKPD